MIIRSNPKEEFTEIIDGDDKGIGSGSIRLNVTEEQLELIAAYLAFTRLGNGTYKQAAYQLISAISNEYGEIFFDECMNNVDMYATIEDSAGDVILQTNDGEHEFTIEV